MKIRTLLFIALFLFTGTGGASAQWSAIPQLQYTNIKCFLTIHDSMIFVAGDNRTLLRSTNNGSTWTSVVNGIEADTLLSLGSGGGYIFAGAYGISSVYRSSNNGDSWSAANQGLPAFAQVNAFTWIDSTLYLAANEGVFRSTDNGGHWQADTAGLGLKLLYPGQIGGIAGITSVGPNLYAIKVSGGGVYTSYSDSASWVPIGLDTVWGYAVTAVGTNVFAGTPQGVYLYSDSGTTWLPRSNGLPGYLSYCILTTADTLLFAYIGMRNGDLYATSDLGQQWTKVDVSVFAGKSIHAMGTTKQYLVIGTENGAWRFPLAEIPTSVNDEHFHTPTGYALSQNYPNPFNPETNFQFTIADFQFVTLKVFDELGREVAVLVNEHKPAGTYTVRWDATSYSSGIYFYQLQAGSFVETKKMVLMK